MGVFLFSKSKFANRAAGKEVMQMPRMPKYLKREWAFFLDERGRKKYNELCRKCEIADGRNITRYPATSC